MNILSYATLDVFASKRFEGNPLAVILNARGLSDDTMQKIAAEFNYSEVTFVLPPEDPTNTAKVRIFTPTMEVPFAGHPNVGTAYLLGQQSEIFGKALGDTLRFEEKAGIVEVSLKRREGVVVATSIRAPEPLRVGQTIADDVISACIAIDSSAIRKITHTPVFVSVGLNFAIAELDNLQTLASARPIPLAFQTAAGEHATNGHDFSLFVYVRDPSTPRNIRARMFAPLDNVTEDPATGSASGALAAYLVSLEPEPNLTVAITIEQGVEMGRRSVIELEVKKASGVITDVFITGNCIPVMTGKLTY